MGSTRLVSTRSCGFNSSLRGGVRLQATRRRVRSAENRAAFLTSICTSKLQKDELTNGERRFTYSTPRSRPAKFSCVVQFDFAARPLLGGVDHAGIERSRVNMQAH